MSPKKYLVLAEIEGTQFTDPSPSKTTDAMLVRNLSVSPLKVTNESRELVRPYFGNSEQIPVSQEATISFEVEVAGAGAAGTAAPYGVLLRACGFAQTLTPATKAEYLPRSTGFETITIYAYRDGLLYRLYGCAGTFTMEFSAKKLPVFKFTFTGQAVTVADAAMPADATLTAWQLPKASIPQWMGTVTLANYAAKISAFSIDMANQVSHAIWMNDESLAITDRKPKGSMTVEAVTVATFDYWGRVANATAGALVLTQGTQAGNIVTVTAPSVQLSDIAEAEYENTYAFTCNLTLNPSSGNDEVKITLT